MVEIITDSSVLYTEEDAKAAGFEAIPMCVHIGDMEGRDLKIDMEEFYWRIAEGQVPCSSQPPWFWSTSSSGCSPKISRSGRWKMPVLSPCSGPSSGGSGGGRCSRPTKSITISSVPPAVSPCACPGDWARWRSPAGPAPLGLRQSPNVK